MILVIEYDRAQGRSLQMERFADDDRAAANQTRLGIELRLFRERIVREVVTLQAASEAILRRTHTRYFTSSPTAEALLALTGLADRAS